MDLPPAEARSGIGQEITTIYDAQYRSLVRLAVLLIGDVGAAEEAVQDSFVALHRSWRRLPDPGKALCYLQQSVVDRSRSILRYRQLAGLGAPSRKPEIPGTWPAITQPERAQPERKQPERTPVICALHTLPPRQREALVLRFYLDLPEEQVASAMGISQDAVTRHADRAMAALSGVLKQPG